MHITTSTAVFLTSLLISQAAAAPIAEKRDPIYQGVACLQVGGCGGRGLWNSKPIEPIKPKIPKAPKPFNINPPIAYPMGAQVAKAKREADKKVEDFLNSLETRDADSDFVNSLGRREAENQRRSELENSLKNIKPAPGNQNIPAAPVTGPNGNPRRPIKPISVPNMRKYTTCAGINGCSKPENNLRIFDQINA
ncbi:hypothetical protein B0O99DRAFT_636188 [Bisporella sp. PMI_857]|nr:hypothetical protein B0O99DRAFT_636188 [Bisporella sp. PMI_857]